MPWCCMDSPEPPPMLMRAGGRALGQLLYGPLVADCCCCCWSIKLNEEARESPRLGEASSPLRLCARTSCTWPWGLLQPVVTLPHWLGRSRTSSWVSEPGAAGPCGGALSAGPWLELGAPPRPQKLLRGDPAEAGPGPGAQLAKRRLLMSRVGAGARS